ncbi:MAG: hypothetical protein Q4F84_04830, partial [Fibrobacter sp.]|nr:hypothetical protein [Fibrobacter sp.]
GEHVLGLSHNQFLCIILFVVFGGLILKNLLFKNEAANESGKNISGNSSNEPKKLASAEQK